MKKNRCGRDANGVWTVAPKDGVAKEIELGRLVRTEVDGGYRLAPVTLINRYKDMVAKKAMTTGQVRALLQQRLKEFAGVGDRSKREVTRLEKALAAFA